MFGILNPRKVASTDVLDKLFAFTGEKEYNDRGSSANWPDESDFGSGMHDLSIRPAFNNQTLPTIHE